MLAFRIGALICVLLFLLCCPVIFGRGFDAGTHNEARLTRFGCLGAVTKPSLSNISFISSKDVEVPHKSIAIKEQFARENILELIIDKKEFCFFCVNRINGRYKDLVKMLGLAIVWNQWDFRKRVRFADSNSHFYNSTRCLACILDKTGIDNFPPIGIHAGKAGNHPASFTANEKFTVFFGGLGVILRSLGCNFRCLRLPFHNANLIADETKSFVGIADADDSGNGQDAVENPKHPISPIPRYRHGGKFADVYGLYCICGGCLVSIILICWGMFRLEDGRRFSGRIIFVGGLLLYLAAALSSMIGCLPWDWWRCLHDCQDHSEYQGCHGGDIVTQKTSKQYLTNYNFCITFIPTREGAMANVLSKDKQIAVIGALAEGSSIRSIEQITGVHRDTIMRLAVRVGQGCATLLDKKMRNLSCQHLQLDEIWGFIGKKQRHVRPSDDPQYGDVWTFCAIDADTKLVPVFLSGYQAQ